MIGAAFGMADNDVARPRIGQLFGGNFAGMRAGFLAVAILRADVDRTAHTGRCKGCHKRGRGADDHVASRIRLGCGQCLNFGQIGAQPVHLPVSGGYFAGHGPSSRRICDTYRALGARQGRAPASENRQRPARPVAGQVGVVKCGFGQAPVRHPGLFLTVARIGPL